MSMLTVTLAILIAISWNFVHGGGLDLPSYIPKCSLSDPKLSECLIKAANEAIPILAKGDSLYGISPLSPVAYREGVAEVPGINYTVQDLYVDYLENFIVTDAVIDLENHKSSFVGILDKIQAIAQNYTMTDGKILDIPVYGHGKYNFTLVGIKVTFEGNLRFYTKGEHEYLDYFDSKADISVDDMYVYFENLKSPELNDVNAHLRKNWKTLFNRMKPLADIYFDMFLNSQMKAIMNSVPYNKMFLP